MNGKRLTLYRDDSVTQVVYDHVKDVFWTARNTVLTISQYVGNDGTHRYINWPRERFAWFKVEPSANAPRRARDERALPRM